MFDLIRYLPVLLKILDELKKLTAGQEVCIPISIKGLKYQGCFRITPVELARTVRLVK